MALDADRTEEEELLNNTFPAYTGRKAGRRLLPHKIQQHSERIDAAKNTSKGPVFSRGASGGPRRWSTSTAVVWAETRTVARLSPSSPLLPMGALHTPAGTARSTARGSAPTGFRHHPGRRKKHTRTPYPTRWPKADTGPCLSTAPFCCRRAKEEPTPDRSTRTARLRTTPDRCLKLL